MTPEPGAAVLACSAGCAGGFPVFEAIYACPRCGALLDVRHDPAALGRRSGAEWRALFDSRGPASAWPLASGVWGKREWVLPGLPDGDVVSLGEGWTSLVPAPRAGAALGHERLRVKQCGTSHSGSFKDLGMTVLVSAVRHRRRERGGPAAIACASTGDTSAALAAYSAAAGIPCAVLLPRGLVSPAQLVQPLAHGARVLSLSTDFDGCMRIVKALAAEGTVYLANSMNPLRLEGQKTVAVELAQQLSWTVPDWVFLPGGNLGNTAALCAGFTLARDLGLIDRLPRICVAQSAAASPLYESFRRGFSSLTPVAAGPTAATAIRIGDPVSAPRALRALRACDGRVEEVGERALAEAARLCARAGLYPCPQTAVALAALRQAAAAGAVLPDEEVVVLATAHGLKFTEFEMAVARGSLPGAQEDVENVPIELPAELAAVRAAIHEGAG